MIINNRYVLEEELGSGGMGVVYRGEDRLSGTPIALKRLVISAEVLAFMSTRSSTDMLLSLAHEFELLASARHPYIIQVFDYGFDETKNPYLVMELLQDAVPITAQGGTLEMQTRLLIQALQAVAYLHRRGIIHRDLKPSNVLVVDDKVKVLDFGLSLKQGDQQESTEGTLGYMAPEVLQEGMPSKSADLYAVGVIAYELFTGELPFYRPSLEKMTQAICLDPPNLDRPNLPPPLREIVGRLLAKRPEGRYPSAETVTDVLSEAVGLDVVETVEIRESYLQAARFVGREQELQQLTGVFESAEAGQGSSWLIGGESGVGKSRLLDELRTYAMIRGALVLRGQAVEGGGLVYQLWRDPMRPLVLSVELSDLEASILKAVVPDIERLLRRPIPEVEPLEAQAEQDRLSLTIADLFRRQTRPVMLLLEDLHWTSESLEPLRQLNRIVGQLPLLIAASYRDDEAPDLPKRLPSMAEIKLERFSEESVAELSESMLGEAGRHEPMVDRLYEETEGNVFFVVEVIRALAESVGQLQDIRHMTLPRKIFAGGIQTIVQRRLGQVPEEAQPLLKLAAVYGRRLDLAILRHLTTQDIDHWLDVCVNAAVLDVQDGNWRFVHDKLREGLLDSLEEAERPRLHRQIAGAIEAAYSDDDGFAAVLADHWYAGHAMDQSLHYAQLAGKQALLVGDYREAIRLLKRALDLAPAAHERIQILQYLGDAREGLGEYEPATAYYQESKALAERLDERAAVAESLLGLAQVQRAQGFLNESAALRQESLAIYREIGDRQGEGRALGALGSAYTLLGDLDTGLEYTRQALEISRETGSKRNEGTWLGLLSVVYRRKGRHDESIKAAEQGLAINRELGDRRSESAQLGRLGQTYMRLGQSETAAAFFRQSAEIAREIGNKHSESTSLSNLGVIYLDLCYIQEAIASYKAAFEITSAINAHHSEAVLRFGMGEAFQSIGEFDKAYSQYTKAYEIARQLEVKWLEWYACSYMGGYYAGTGEYGKSRDCYQQGRQLAIELEDLNFHGLMLDGLSRIALLTGDPDAALQHAQAAAQMLSEAGDPEGLCMTRLNLGWALLAVGKPAEACESLTQAAGSNFDKLNYQAMAALGAACLRAGDAQAAREGFGQALEHAGTLVSRTARYQPAWAVLGLARAGLALLGDGDIAPAAEAYRQVLEIAPYAGIRDEEVNKLGELARLDDTGVLQPLQELLLGPA